MANPQIIVEYIAKTAGLAAGTSAAEQSGGRMSKTFKGVAAAVGTGLAVGAVVQFGKASVQAATESQQATDRLRQVFKSMGDETGRAADAAIAYAGKLSKKIGVDDDAIITSQALLATFGKVSDETARTAGVFDRATAAAADLAAAGFGSMDDNAKQLGKALNDPIKGLTSLTRSGVSFTESEKARIKTLVESNKTTEAQQLILAAVEKQVGGVAAATATGQQKMAVAYGEVQESVGAGLLPVLQALAPVLVAVADFTAKNTTLVLALGGAMLGAVIAVKALTLAQALLNVTMSANVIGLVIVGLAALIAIGILVARNWDTISATLKRGFAIIKNAAQDVFNWIKANWPLLLAILGGPLGAAVAVVIRHWDRISDAVKSAVTTARNVLSSLKDWVAGAFANAVRAAAHAVGNTFDFIADGARDAYAAVRNQLNNIVDFIQNVVGRVRGAASSVANAIKAPINAILSAWNSVSFTIPRISIPKFKIGPKTFGGGGFGGQTIGFPDVPLLQAGGVIDVPTLALIGEGPGREIVTPEKLLRDIVGERPVEVRVFIGDQELKGIVRTEVRDANLRTAQVLLAGRAG